MLNFDRLSVNAEDKGNLNSFLLLFLHENVGARG